MGQVTACTVTEALCLFFILFLFLFFCFFFLFLIFFFGFFFVVTFVVCDRVYSYLGGLPEDLAGAQFIATSCPIHSM